MQENKYGGLKVLGGVLAFLTVLLVGFLLINEKYGWIGMDQANILKTLYIVKNYMVVASLAVVGFVFASKRGAVVFILYMGAIITVLVFAIMKEGGFLFSEIMFGLGEMLEGLF